MIVTMRALLGRLKRFYARRGYRLIGSSVGRVRGRPDLCRMDLRQGRWRVVDVHDGATCNVWLTREEIAAHARGLMVLRPGEVFEDDAETSASAHETAGESRGPSLRLVWSADRDVLRLPDAS